jgi:hypothetical protein
LENASFWGVACDDRFVERRPIERSGHWTEEEGLSLQLNEAMVGQAARTAVAAAGDGRIAIYRGRRIQFFAHPNLAPETCSITTESQEGQFQQIFWDRTGRALGATFALDHARLRLEAWQTSSNFPPSCQRLRSAILDCERITPANDGRHWLGRGTAGGIFLFDPGTGVQSIVNSSNDARQEGPLQASPEGKLLAIVSNSTQLRLLALPSGSLYAELESPRRSAITAIAWDKAGRQIACLTEDGYLQRWNLGPWRTWISANGLER